MTNEHLYCHRRAASAAPGSFNAAGGGALAGWATGDIGAACVGGIRDVIGILTNCSLMNSFSLQTNVRMICKRSRDYW